MTSAKRRRKDRRSGVGRSPGTTTRAPAREPSVPRPLTTRGLASDEACARLSRLRNDDTDNFIRRRRAHTDDLIRVLRNLTVLAVFASTTLSLVAYAGVRMGIPAEACVVGSFSAAVVLVRTFAKAFESVRPSLPDAPEDPPSTDER
ncbi:hypothetical protein [Streptomyces sp. NPDC050263]|uniref:hypothetical protein n=1 Tax=Streptomyces sp. NPDC050263 TaxID=3155037 RepID=UPI00343CAC2D